MQKNSIKSRPEKRVTKLNVIFIYQKRNCIQFAYTDLHFQTKTNLDSIERFEDLENLSLDAQENIPEQIDERQRREADQANLKQQESNDETDANDQQNMD